MSLQHQHSIKNGQTLTFAVFQARKITFFHVFEDANVFVNSFISNVSAVSLSIDIVARFVSLSTVIADM